MSANGRESRDRLLALTEWEFAEMTSYWHQPVDATGPAAVDILGPPPARAAALHRLAGRLDPADELWLPGLETVEPYQPADAPLYEYLLGPYSADVSRWVSLARVVGGPVLDVGSGTGRLAVPLVEAGVTVDALDRNLAGIRRRLPGHGTGGSHRRLRLLLQDLNDLALDRTAGYRLIFLIGTMISAVPASRRAAVLGELSGALHPDGHLVLDYCEHRHPDGTAESDRFWAFRVPRWDHIGHLAIVRQYHDLPRRIETLTYYSEEWTSDGTARRHTSATARHLVDSTTVLAELARAGLVVARAERRDVSDRATYVLFVCRRAG